MSVVSSLGCFSFFRCLVTLCPALMLQCGVPFGVFVGAMGALDASSCRGTRVTQGVLRPNDPAIRPQIRGRPVLVNGSPRVRITSPVT